MKEQFLLKISATVLALILFSASAGSLPLTKTLYIARADLIDLSVSSDYIFAEKQIVVEKFSAATGLWSGGSINARFEVMGHGAAGFDRSGDSFVEFMSYMDSLSSGNFRAAYFCSLRLPSGPDAYRFEEYRNAAFGNNEIKTGAVGALEISENNMIFMNLFYTFRQGEREGFYSGFMINPADSSSWKSLFGLNPFYGDAFLHYKKLANDYVSASGAWIYSGLSPVILFTEIYFSSRVCYSSEYIKGIPIEGDQVNPLFICQGFKLYLNDSFFFQGHCFVDPLMEDGFVKWQAGFLFNLIF